MDEIKNRAEQILQKLDLASLRGKIVLLEKESSNSDFWLDHKAAAIKMKELASLQKLVDDGEKLSTYIKNKQEEHAKTLLEDMEMFLYLSGQYDNGNAIVSIHSGQGGVEAMDWAAMLFRMYSRYCETKDWKIDVIDESAGDEAGLKSVVFTVSGQYAYGYLRGEAGVHRLVRLSPFNADSLRQTSFAQVLVLPEIEDDQSVVINEDDLEWDFYRASSHGGQNVQKVSSAVRLTHTPTGIVVTCQTERYQNQNREYALKLLKAKLWQKQEEERKKEEAKLRGEYKTPGWGNQIRSYVLHPYHMVKDLRTNYETSDTEGVLDGKLDAFIDAELKIS